MLESKLNNVSAQESINRDVHNPVRKGLSFMYHELLVGRIQWLQIILDMG